MEAETPSAARTEGEESTGVNEKSTMEKMVIADDERLPLIGGEAESNDQTDSSDGNKRTKKQVCGFPTAIFFIIGNEFCERFSYYGMKGILVIYLTSTIGFSPSAGTAISHGFNMLSMFTPLIGAVIADSCWGRYKTILVISLIYALGNVVLAVTAIPSLGATEGNWYGPMIGLLIIGFGTGGIKPCVSAFGGDQFDESEKEKSQKFFSFFYAAINAGSLLSLFITPFFKGNVQCFGGPCYFLAFGVPAVLMVVAIMFFVIGGLGGAYVKVPPKGSVFKEAYMCVSHALSRKWRFRGGDEKRSQWLDWADDQFSPRLISDVKSVLNVFTVFAPLPLFWALYDQQGTRWVLQSQKMDARLGSFVFQPEQLQVLNPIFILTLIPIFDHLVYPLAERCVKTTPLRRIAFGMVLAGIAFLISGFLEKAIEDSSFVDAPPADHSFLSVFNAHSKPIRVKVGDIKEFRRIEPLNGRLDLEVLTPTKPSLTIQWGSGDDTSSSSTSQTLVISLDGFVPEKTRIIVHFVPDTGGSGSGGDVQALNYFASLARPLEYNAVISVVSTLQQTIKIKNLHQLGAVAKEINPDKAESTLTLAPGSFSITVDKEESELEILNGGIYSIAAFRNKTGKVALDQQVVLAPYSLNVFLQVPQILVISMGEIMVSITGISFAYSQAPNTMKSLLQAGWLLTIFAGNLIDVIVIATQSIKTLWVELFFFAALIFLFTIPFVLLARNYKYVEDEEEKSD